jgi:uncharacterized protein (TIGR03083 family)
VTDDRELGGLDPYDLLDREAARLDAHFSSITGDAWARPSRCAGWTTRDVLCHLTSSEDYHRACLDHTVQQFFAAGSARGLDSLEAWNDDGIRQFDGAATDEVVEQWRTRNAASRAGFRAAEGTLIDTSIGDYPCRWQASHVALELATHADDIGVPERDDEAAARVAWRARVSRFALAEAKPEISVERLAEGTTRVSGQGEQVELGDGELVEAVAARLDEHSRLSATERALLSSTP